MVLVPHGAELHAEDCVDNIATQPPFDHGGLTIYIGIYVSISYIILHICHEVHINYRGYRQDWGSSCLGPDGFDDSSRRPRVADPPKLAFSHLLPGKVEPQHRGHLTNYTDT